MNMETSLKNNHVICVITAIDIEFEAIIHYYNLKKDNIFELDDELLIAECIEKRLVVAQAGIGKLRAERCAEALYRQYPYMTAYVSFGIAGALSDYLNVGDIVIGNSIIDINDQKKDETYTPIYKTEKEDAYIGPVICSNEFINDQNQKKYLYNTYGALCVEMESSGIAQFSKDKNLPIIVIKIISDHADERSFRSILRLQKSFCKTLTEYLDRMIDQLDF